MQMRRLTRLTNGLSKKWENLWAAYRLRFAYYNFSRIQRLLARHANGNHRSGVGFGGTSGVEQFEPDTQGVTNA
jgi:hypothetical protein